MGAPRILKSLALPTKMKNILGAHSSNRKKNSAHSKIKKKLDSALKKWENILMSHSKNGQKS